MNFKLDCETGMLDKFKKEYPDWPKGCEEWIRECVRAFSAENPGVYTLWDIRDSNYYRKDYFHGVEYGEGELKKFKLLIINEGRISDTEIVYDKIEVYKEDIKIGEVVHVDLISKIVMVMMKPHYKDIKEEQYSIVLVGKIMDGRVVEIVKGSIRPKFTVEEV